LKLQKEKNQTYSETQLEHSLENPYIQVQTEPKQELQLTTSKENYTTEETEDNNSNLVQKTNTSSPNLELFKLESETATADTQKEEQEKITEVATSEQGSFSY
ncbi:1955_t:CDS:2, partial [Scutellospora calospora]